MTPVFVPDTIAETVVVAETRLELGDLAMMDSTVCVVSAGDDHFAIDAPLAGYVLARREVGDTIRSSEEPVVVLDSLDDAERRESATALLMRYSNAKRETERPADLPEVQLEEDPTGRRITTSPEAAARLAQLRIDPKEVYYTLLRFRLIPIPSSNAIVRITEKMIDQYLRAGTELAIIGANDEALVLLDIIRHSEAYSHYVVSIYDNDMKAIGQLLGGARVVSNLDGLAVRDSAGTIGAVGIAARGKQRRKIVDWAYGANLRGQMRPFVSEAAFVASDALVGVGTTICAGATVASSATIGVGCYIAHGAVVGPHAVLEDHCEVAEGAAVGQRAILTRGAKVFPVSAVPPKAKVGKDLDFRGSRMVKRRG